MGSNDEVSLLALVPAEAGTQRWIPAYAGMSGFVAS
jgi:hypothetical protein